jgi:hypothetical protein
LIHLLRHRAKKALGIALIGVGRGLRGKDYGGNVNSVQHKSTQKCHYESSPPYNEYTILKVYKIKKKEI